MYSHVFVAGTFDNLHNGHEAIFHAAFREGKYVIIGLTSDLFVKTYKKNVSIQPFAARKQHLLSSMSSNNFEIIPIDDPYEPAASMNDLDALIVTSDNRDRGEEINKRRSINGLKTVELIEVPIVPAQNTQPMSSTRIRNGEIDRTGRLTLPDTLRPELANPLGNVLTGDAIGTSIEKNRSGIVISVGDMTANTLLTAGVVPNLIIVDFQVGRKPYADNDAKFIELNLYRIAVTSGPGFIAKEAIEMIRKWAKHPAEKMILAVAGEEDLLALPAVAYGPTGAIVYYGQPEKGMVEVVITQEKQTEAEIFMNRFDTP